MVKKKFDHNHKSKGILLIALALLFAGIGGYAIYKSYAYSSPYIMVCNSSNSNKTIRVYSYKTSDYVPIGDCSKTFDNIDNIVRVDVDPYGTDIDSYKLGVIGSAEGYGGCHDHSGNPASDPPNAVSVRYRNYYGVNC